MRSEEPGSAASSVVLEMLPSCSSTLVLGGSFSVKKFLSKKKKIVERRDLASWFAGLNHGSVCTVMRLIKIWYSANSAQKQSVI